MCTEENLQDLHERLKERVYAPSHSTKLFFPKRTGILRPFSLLTIEDQIVYQALVNVVADSLLPHARNQYYKTVFGNLYAGKRSKYFYRSWEKAYSRFSRSIGKAFFRGFVFTASFDLTACYDSIDHRVLKHFLSRIGMSKDFCQELCTYLSVWTSSSPETPIYQGHGIPQGPLASGILAECVLKHFDDNYGPTTKIRYFRYVDDIRLFAKSELELAQSLIRLDRFSKQIGLFPQSGKIDTHRIKNIAEETKTLSDPAETAVITDHPDQSAIRKRLIELSPRFEIKNETRFKFVLGRTLPTSSIGVRLSRILIKHPHLYQSICRCLKKSSLLPKRVSHAFLRVLLTHRLYASLAAELLSTLSGRIHPKHRSALLRYCKRQLRPGGLDPYYPELRAACASFLVQSVALTYKQIKYNVRWSKNWWVRTTVVRHIPKYLLCNHKYTSLINKLLRDDHADVALVATEILVENNIPLLRPVNRVHRLAQIALKKTGLIQRVGPTSCPIKQIMEHVLGVQTQPINWPRLLGTSKYRQVRRRVVRWSGYFETEPSSWVLLTDTINEFILVAVTAHDVSVGTYTMGGQIGGFIGNPTSRFATKYPKFHAALKVIHSKRLESELAHPIKRNTGKFTRPIEFSELSALKSKLREGYVEAWNKLAL